MARAGTSSKKNSAVEWGTPETLAAAIHASPAALIVLDAGGLVRIWNAAAERVLGWTQEEVLGKPYPAVPKDKKREHLELRQRVLAGEDLTELEVSRRRKDGTPIDLSLSTRLLRDANGNMVGVLSVIADITARKRAESALRQSQAELREAQALAHVGSWTWDIRENRVNWSDEMFRIFGTEPGSFEVTYEAFLERVHPDDRPHIDIAVRKAFLTGHPFTFEHRIVRPDGSVCIVLARGQVEMVDGQPVRMVGTGQDITEARQAAEELQRSERNLRLLAHSATELIISYDMQRRLTFVNSAVEQITGYSADEMYRSNFIDWIHPDDRERMMGLWDGLFRGESFVGVEFRAVHKDGRVRWRMATWGPLRDEQGRQIGVQGREQDITHLKQIEEQLRRASDDLEARVAERTQELERANHELRRQQVLIDELSTPVLQIRAQLLLVPVIGALTTERTRQLTQQLLFGIRTNRARAVVLDVTGVATVDSNAANLLVQTIDAARLLGAACIVTGMSSGISRALVELGLDLSLLRTRGDLQSGIEEAMGVLGVR